MKLKILIASKSELNKNILKTCWSKNKNNTNIEIESSCLIKGKTQIKELIQAQILYYAKQYIQDQSGNDKYIRCPKVKVTLPIDRWDCKIDKEMCHFGSQIDLSNKNEFLNKCRLPIGDKNGIWKILRKGEYDGFHHIPGRYLCPECESQNKSEKKINFNYHYPWELNSLANFFEKYKDDLDFKRHLMLNNIPTSVLWANFCPKCFIKLKNKLNKYIENWEYEEYIIEYKRTTHN